MYRALIVDDEPLVRAHLLGGIDWQRHGFHLPQEAADGHAGLEVIRDRGPFDLALVDIRMPRLDGLGFIRALRAQRSRTLVVILSGYDDFAYAREAIRLGVHEYLLKPFDVAAIHAILRQIGSMRRTGYVERCDDDERRVHDRLFGGDDESGSRRVDRDAATAIVRAQVDRIRFAVENRDTEGVACEVSKLVDALRRTIPQVAILEFSLVELFLVVEATTGGDPAVVPKATDVRAAIREARSLRELEAWVVKRLALSWAALPARYTRDSHVKAAIAYVDRHGTDPDISLTEISRAVALNCSYLSTIFKQQTGRSVVEYLTERRMLQALQAIAARPDAVLIDIAAKVGYRDPYYFSKCFKRRFGVSPTQYRRRVASRDDP